MCTLIFIGKCFNSNRKDLLEVIKKLLCVVESITWTKGDMYLPETFLFQPGEVIYFLSLRMFFSSREKYKQLNKKIEFIRISYF